MSPLVVRRYRAERLLREEFEALRESVIRAVRARLRAAGVHLDAGELEACYSQAWQGLYAAVLDGAQVENRAAWLSLVTYRRAIDEHRARRAMTSECLDDGCGQCAGGSGTTRAATDAGGRDIAAELDDRARLRQLFEALRTRLNTRERQAAVLCYLQGLSRADAAACLGVSESRMRKLMEGRGAGDAGVAAKIGALVRTIDAGAWCEEQGSLMRGLAYGILDPDGERHRLAQLHSAACPACRAYVLSLRGLAAVLPPAPLLLSWVLGAKAATSVAGAGAGGATAPGGALAPGAAGAAAPGTVAGGAGPAGAGLAGGVLGTSGVVGAGAAGGGWWLAGGPLGAKLAVGCLLALGVGAGCVALEGGTGRARRSPHRRQALNEPRRPPLAPKDVATVLQAAGDGRPTLSTRRPTGSHTSVAGAAQASREFGPERAAIAGASSASSGAANEPSATASSTRSSAAAGATSVSSPAASQAPAGRATSGDATPAAQREFSPG